MFRSFGHEQSSVLDGGLPRWESEGLPTESGPVAATPKTKYPAPTLASENIRSKYSRAVLEGLVAQSSSQDYEQIVSNAEKELSDPLAEIVLDARGHGRYEPDCVTSESDLTSCIDIRVQTLNPGDSLQVICHTRSLFHSARSCRRTRATTLVPPSRHSFLRRSSAGSWRMPSALKTPG